MHRQLIPSRRKCNPIARCNDLFRNSHGCVVCLKKLLLRTRTEIRSCFVLSRSVASQLPFNLHLTNDLTPQCFDAEAQLCSVLGSQSYNNDLSSTIALLGREGNIINLSRALEVALNPVPYLQRLPCDFQKDDDTSYTLSLLLRYKETSFRSRSNPVTDNFFGQASPNTFEFM